MAKLRLVLCFFFLLSTISYCQEWNLYSEWSDDEVIPYSGKYAIPGESESLLQDVMRKSQDDGWGGSDDFGSDFDDSFGEDDNFGSDFTESTKSKEKGANSKSAVSGDFGSDFDGDFADDFGGSDEFAAFGTNSNKDKAGKNSKSNTAGSKNGFGSGFGDNFKDVAAGSKDGKGKKGKLFGVDDFGKGFGKSSDFGKGFDEDFRDLKSDSASFFGAGKGGKGEKGFGKEFGSDFEAFEKGDKAEFPTFKKNNKGGGYQLSRGSTDSPEMPATCNCKKQQYGGGTCYFFTDERNGICARRDCMPKYVCVNGPSSKHGILCMKRKTVSKIVKTGQHTCVRKKTDGYMYVPYTAT